MICNVLPALESARGKRARTDPDIVRAAPVSPIVLGVKSRTRIIRNLVVLVASPLECRHRQLKKARFRFIMRGKFAALESCEKLSVLFVGETVGRNMFGLEHDRFLQGLAPLHFRLSG